MSLYAIETETHNEETTTHFFLCGSWYEGKNGRWQALCGRYVSGSVWEQGSVEGVRCLNCVKKQVKRQERGERT